MYDLVLPCGHITRPDETHVFNTGKYGWYCNGHKQPRGYVRAIIMCDMFSFEPYEILANHPYRLKP